MQNTNQNTTNEISEAEQQAWLAGLDEGRNQAEAKMKKMKELLTQVQEIVED